MKAIIDTCSLISLVRYYLPFDTKNELFESVKKLIEDRTLIIIDEVLTECKRNSGGLVIVNLPYLADATFQKANGVGVKTDELIPPKPKKFYHLLDFDYKTDYARSKLNADEFEVEKRIALEGADFRMLLFALNQLTALNLERIIIVTEESETEPANAFFRKIPVLCRPWANIEVMTLPAFLKVLGFNSMKFDS